MEILPGIKKLFLYYRVITEKALHQIANDQFFVQPSDHSNSIAIIVQHVSGNMKSRFTDFLTTDGEKPWRNRDAEFEPKLLTVAEVWNAWNEGWNVFLATLNSISEADLEKVIYIRNEGQTVLDALQRQLAHYPYHFGQIIFLCKLLQTGNWQTLSIAKNQSSDYNANKFSTESKHAHFTDAEIQKHLPNEK